MAKNSGKIFYQWGGTTAAFFAYTHLSHDLSTGLLVALLPLIKESLGLSYLQAGLLLSAYTITAGLSQFLGGWLCDRISRQIVIAMGLGGVAFAALAFGLSSAYYPMLIILVIMGVFAGAYHPSATSMLSDIFLETRRGKVVALHMAGGSVGYFIGPVLGGIIAGILGWHFAFIILSVLPLIAVPLILKHLKPQKAVSDGKLANHAPAKDDTLTTSKHRPPGLWQVLRPVAIITTLTILTQFVAGTVTSFIPIYLVDKHSVAPAYAAIWLGVIRGGGIVGSLFGGWLSDKWNRRGAILLALVAIGPILYLLTKLPFNAVFMISMVIFGIVMMMRPAVIQALLMDSTPPRLRGAVFGIYFGLGMEGMSLLQPVAGHFMDIFGIVQVFNVIALTSVALSVVALLWAVKLKLHR